MELTKEIKKMLVEKDMTATQLAEKIGMSQGNLSTKMKNESYSVQDLIKIAEATGYELKISFVKDDMEI
ncbi:helix-turn-helix transcriptional regulator [Solibacillus sp. FSL R7-0668]|uniref:helix-turn-helix domain-containing protein n=1 Tax=Solibacillus sp. FSL R7-0668 TaxID=2921688 RepID=UPI0030F9685A